MNLTAPVDSRAASARTLRNQAQTDWRFWYQRIRGGPRLWAKQELIWDSVLSHERTLVTSGHATGKDFTIGQLVPWFLTCWAPSIVITTAPTDRQVRHILWGEIRNAVNTSTMRLGGTLLEQEWRLSDRHYAIGFTTRDYANASQRFHGFHQESVFIVLSEASGIHPSIWESIEGLAIGEHVRLLAVSQPTGDIGPFYEALRTGCRKGAACRCTAWHIIEISSWEAAEANESLGIKALANRAWCQDRLERWGEASPLYQARVLGKVPESLGDRIIQLGWAVRATELELSEQGPCGIGVDVAWQGEDDSVVSVVRGQRMTRLEVVHGQNTLELASLVMRIVREEGIKTVAVDVGGVGAGVYDQLMSLAGETGLSVLGVNFGSPASREEDYADKGAEMWWRLREDLRRGTFQLLPMSHPETEELLQELTSRSLAKTKPDKMGRIKLESKQDMRKRGIKSPDRVDSLLLAREACQQMETPMLVGTIAEERVEEDQAVWHPA